MHAPSEYIILCGGRSVGTLSFLLKLHWGHAIPVLARGIMQADAHYVACPARRREDRIPAPAAPDRWLGSLSDCRLGEWQCEPEGGSLPNHALDPDPSAVSLNDGFADVQSKPQAATQRLPLRLDSWRTME